MAMSSGNMVAATAVCAITWVSRAVMTKQPSMISDVFSPMMLSIL